MQTIHDIIAMLDNYCREVGRKPSYIGSLATGNPRLRERLKRRAEQTDKDAAALAEFMEKHPPGVKK